MNSSHGLILAVAIGCMAIGMGITALIIDKGPEATLPDFDMALLGEGHNLPTVNYLNDLPTEVLTTDSAGNVGIAARVFWTERDSIGEPLIAVVYEVKGVFLNNLPKVEADTTVDTSGVEK